MLRAPDQAVIRTQLAALKQSGIESVAICLLHSFAHPEHDKLVERLARQAGFSEGSTSSTPSPRPTLVPPGHRSGLGAYANPIAGAHGGRRLVREDGIGGRVGTLGTGGGGVT